MIFPIQLGVKEPCLVHNLNWEAEGFFDLLEYWSGRLSSGSRIADFLVLFPEEVPELLIFRPEGANLCLELFRLVRFGYGFLHRLDQTAKLAAVDQCHHLSK